MLPFCWRLRGAPPMGVGALVAGRLHRRHAARARPFAPRCLLAVLCPSPVSPFAWRFDAQSTSSLIAAMLGYGSLAR